MTPSFPSIAAMFWDRAQKSPSAEAFRFPVGTEWQSLSWQRTGERVRHIAAGLISLGIKSEERCAIVSSTRLDWILADLGILCAGGATTTIYPSNVAEECAYILKDSSTVLVFAENDAQVKKLVQKRGELPEVHHVIVFDGKGGEDGWVLSLADLEARGKEYHHVNPHIVRERSAAVRPESLATLIYTSGTTGQPKGVELTNACWVFEGDALAQMNILTEQDVQYLWLPLAHSFGKVLEAAQLRVGFTTAIDGRIDKIIENLAVIKPTFVAAVPRIFEKVYNRVSQQAKAGGGFKYKIFQWALKTGRQVSAIRQKNQDPQGLLGLQYRLADKLVFSKLRERFGGRLRFFISGSAPLSREIAEFFHAANILVLEGYGLTETSAGAFVNRPASYRFGTVGLPFEGVQVKIAESDGEVLLKGPNVMRGYRNLPEANAEVFDADGWFHTGDIGNIEPGGFLKITDRKKDLIKTSGGKYVAPQMIEGKLKSSCPYLGQVVVHGNNRNFCSALATIDEESIKKWASENGVGNDYALIVAHPKTKELLQGYFDQVNKELPSYETIKKFAILPQDFTEATGELTASLKVKRKVVEQKYKNILDGFYAGAIE
jgi:long-chain acyl-CoA synthetase